MFEGGGYALTRVSASLTALPAAVVPASGTPFLHLREGRPVLTS